MRRSSRNSALAATVLGATLSLAAAMPGAAQTTIDGTYCIIFVPGTIHGELARCARLLGKGHPLEATTLTLALHGDLPNIVHEVTLSLDGAAPFQTLAVSAQPPITKSDVGVIFIDMNFDGYFDFGVMTTAAAGPAVTYQWFLLRPKERRFAASAQLSALADPRPDHALQRIVVERHEGPAGYDLYRWKAGALLRDERIERQCAGARCTCRHLRPGRHGFTLLRTVACI